MFILKHIYYIFDLLYNVHFKCLILDFDNTCFYPFSHYVDCNCYALKYQSNSESLQRNKPA